MSMANKTQEDSYQGRRVISTLQRSEEYDTRLTIASKNFATAASAYLIIINHHLGNLLSFTIQHKKHLQIGLKPLGNTSLMYHWRPWIGHEQKLELSATLGTNGRLYTRGVETENSHTEVWHASSEPGLTQRAAIAMIFRVWRSVSKVFPTSQENRR